MFCAIFVPASWAKLPETMMTIIVEMHGP